MCLSQKILLLDDNTDLLLVMQIILKGQGYESIVASSIEEAASKIKIHHPALILMDIHISDQDGCAFCIRLKQDPSTADIRVIMMSGDDKEPDLLSCTGADDFLQKPFDYNDLLARVERQLEESNVLSR